jgi:hypothetical protein
MDFESRPSRFIKRKEQKPKLVLDNDNNITSIPSEPLSAPEQQVEEVKPKSRYQAPEIGDLAIYHHPVLVKDKLSHKEKIKLQTFNKAHQELKPHIDTMKSVMRGNFDGIDGSHISEANMACVAFITKILNGYDGYSVSERTAEKRRKEFALLTSDKYLNQDYVIDFDKAARTTSTIKTWKRAINRSLFEFRQDVRRAHKHNDIEAVANILSQDSMKPIYIAVLSICENQFLLNGINITHNRKQKLKQELNLSDSRQLNRKRDIDTFEIDWQSRVFDNVSAKYKPVTSVLSLTGCRPEELEHGVRVRPYSQNGLNYIDLTIQNAKIDGARTITHLADKNKFAQFLFAKSEEEYEVMATAKGLREYFRRNRNNWNIANSEKLVSYSYRYSMATSLACEGASKEMLQNTLGHVDETTMGHYIRRQSARVTSFVPSKAIFPERYK